MQRFFQGEFTISNKEGINNLVTGGDHSFGKSDSLRSSKMIIRIISC